MKLTLNEAEATLATLAVSLIVSYLESPLIGDIIKEEVGLTEKGIKELINLRNRLLNSLPDDKYVN